MFDFSPSAQCHLEAEAVIPGEVLETLKPIAFPAVSQPIVSLQPMVSSP